MNIVSFLIRKKREFLFAEELAAAVLVFGLGIAAAVPLIFHTRAIFFEESETATFAAFLLFFILSSAALLLLVRLKRISWIRAIFFFALFAGMFVFFQSFFRFSIAIFLAAFFSVLRVRFSFFAVHNAVMIFAIAGIGAFLGSSVEPRVAAALLLLFAVYDYVAVFLTRHMAPLAKAAFDSSMPLAFLFPDDIRFFGGPIASYPKNRRLLFLGGGDLALPLLLSVSLLQQSPWRSFLVASCSIVGVWVMHTVFSAQKSQTPLPALPPIAAGALLGFFLGVFFHI